MSRSKHGSNRSFKSKGGDSNSPESILLLWQRREILVWQCIGEPSRL
jgi:hypothetical protein